MAISSEKSPFPILGVGKSRALKKQEKQEENTLFPTFDDFQKLDLASWSGSIG